MGFYYENYGISEVPPQSQLAPTVPSESSVFWTPPTTRATSHDNSLGASTTVEDRPNSARRGALSNPKCGSDPQPYIWPNRFSPSFDGWTTGTKTPGFKTEPQCEGIARGHHRMNASTSLRYSPDACLPMALTLEPTKKATRTAPNNRTVASKDRILEFDGNIINSTKWFQSQSPQKRRRTRRK